MRISGILKGSILAGAAIAAFVPAVALAADTGATAGVPMQSGSAWGHGGGVDQSASVASAPMAGPPMQGGYAPDAHMGPPPGDKHGDYRRLDRGARLPHRYRDERLVVSDWRGWGLTPPGPGMAWIRYDDDAVLVDGNDRVVDARYGVGWDRGYHGRGYAGRPGYAGGYGYGPPPGTYPGPGYGYAGPGMTSYRAGPNTMVTTSVTPLGVPAVYSAGGYYGGGYGGGTIVSVTPGMAVTTTTTTTDYETFYKSVGVKKAWRRPIRHYHPRCVRTTCPVQGS